MGSIPECGGAVLVHRPGSRGDGEIRQYFNDSAQDFSSFEGLASFLCPTFPFFGEHPLRTQPATGDYARTNGCVGALKGWNAYAFARVNTTVYFSSSDTVWRIGELPG